MNTMRLFLTNSLGGQKELFASLKPDHVLLYCCGITPYDYSHIGHGRSYVSVDLLARLLKFLGYSVKYVRNFTDIDDKLINKAAAEPGITVKELAQRYIADFHAQVALLNCLEPQEEPRVTEYVPQIVAFIEELIKKDFAYAADGDVYFNTAALTDYGKLSGKKMEDMIAGARVEVNAKKRTPSDFVLWKGQKEGVMWPSPWGNGRPGWHIECSAFIHELMGATIDIHWGGEDLQFPHHENEIAQSESYHGAPLATFWLHNALLHINKEKMSKSLGNSIALNTVLKNYNPDIIRFYILQHHYRMPLDFSDDNITAATATYTRLMRWLLEPTQEILSEHELRKQVLGLPTTSVVHSLIEALCDDLNSPKFFGILFEHASAIKNDAHAKQLIASMLTNVLGIRCKAPQEIIIDDAIQALLLEREQARAQKNWKRSDEIRDELAERGYKVQDKKI